MIKRGVPLLPPPVHTYAPPRCPSIVNRLFITVNNSDKFIGTSMEGGLLPMENLGYFSNPNYYFVTRHPKSTMSDIRPFASLQTKIWLQYSILYVIFMLTSIFVYFVSKSPWSTSWVIRIFFCPVEPWSIDYSYLKFGLIFTLFWPFMTWTFTLFYGIDL